MGGGEGVATGDEQSNAAGVEDVTVNIRCSNGSKFSVQVSLESTVGSLKSVLAQNCDIPAEQQRLIYKGRILKDEETLQNYGLEADHTVHMVRGFVSAASANASSGANTVNPNDVPAARRASNEGGPFGGSGFGASLFEGLGMNGMDNAGGLFGSGLPEFEQVQQQLTQNPNMMRDIMNMPLVQNLVNHPEIMHNLIMNNPQMREIMDRNPELAHILNDPSTLRQTLEAARNPELMREMMRNTDRAMSNIESSPEGFNMLRRMYENVQEPFLNATTMAGDGRNDMGSNPIAALFGAQGVGREQSTNPTSPGSETSANSHVPNTNPLPNPWASAGAAGTQINASARSTAATDTRPTPVGGLSGLGFTNIGQMFGGGLPDPNSMNQIMQNPAVSQMMQVLLSNPQYMNQLRNMVESNPQFREMMQNPEFIGQLTSPETIQQLLSVQQSLFSRLGQQQSTLGRGQTGGGTEGALDNMGLEMMMNMFGALGTGGGLPNRPNVPPEELYAAQLTQLQEMGFIDTQENIRALMASAGNVHAAVERLLGNPGQ